MRLLSCSDRKSSAADKKSNAPVGQIFATLNDENESNMSERYHVSRLLEVFLNKQMASMENLELIR
jgi:hypothetical protein